ncbi:MAG: hypothetical protein E7677_03610 [Ruminococcaceae bacterium]|nr:hypothetical protein [Oscillospiraceae bacterium]
MTEEKNFNCDFMTVKTINTGRGKTWTERLQYALKQIESDYILFSLEDYFVHEEVNEKAFLDAFERMKKKPKWGGIYFHPIKRGSSYPKEFDSELAYRKANRFNKGRTNMMIILYRKDFLEKLLVKKEDAWAFEVNSNIRSIVAGYDVIHYRINDSAPVFKYYNKFVDGVGITSRKWLSRTHEIFEMNGITDVNYNNLGVISSDLAYKDPTDRRTKSKEKLSFKDFMYYYIKRPIKNTKLITLIRAWACWFKYYRNYKNK